jgi:hypothetical protein
MKGSEIFIFKAVTIAFWEPRQEFIQDLTGSLARIEITRSAAFSSTSDTQP